MIPNDPFKTPPSSPREPLSYGERIKKLDQDLREKREAAIKQAHEKLVYEMVISVFEEMNFK